ncbi:MAG: triose-phosphate isomerase [Flavobacteriaceae bacterium]|jgi:triosephosphate isomerase|nr:triose-phosphate isomerase [Flavobacteriaceae bacterium]
MRKHIVAGNWKMNKTQTETVELINELKQQDLDANVGVYISPAFINLSKAVALTADGNIQVAAQNMHQSPNGAFTGEIAVNMLQDIGVNHVILGHSERRAYFGETDELLREKVQVALDVDMEVIFCFGEELNERKEGTHFDVVKKQLTTALFALDVSAWRNIVLAYEPVWAIGTGETASPEQAQEMHAYIRSLIEDHYGVKCADDVSILYGGSVKPANAAEIFAQTDVDGGLIGGASLNATDFAAIVNGFAS